MQKAKEKTDISKYYQTNGSVALQEAAVHQTPQAEEEVPKQNAQMFHIGSSLNLYYTCFLALAAVCVVCGCVHYLQLRAKETALHKEIMSLESQLEEKTLENQNKYRNILNSVDMQEIKRIATEEYGMGTPRSDQVVVYSLPDTDYVRQFRDVD